ncbi:LPS translocon maturation chaperone LptM [Rhizobium halophilum]|uniref:LPS translocon maturation chaperone LptM n=1 Tax=Rhizobium halophilum TaxID=2846852 RepID=UPI001EFDEBB0|nr:lipoprotein [Rhizobium halophilum]MCF6368769.1 lipoprotein [Rhizobium halophilum]
MSIGLQKFGATFLMLAVAGLVLAGCGRKGDLDRPSTPVEQQNIRKSGDARQPDPVSDRPFLLDPLL